MSVIPGWPLHPIENRVRALRLTKDGWKLCDYTDLKLGDIIKPVNPQGEDIDPFTRQYQADNVCIVTVNPQPATEVGDGYEIGLDVVGTLEEALRHAPTPSA